MSDRQLLLKALKCEPTERVPWVPFVGVHGGLLVNKTAEEYLKSADTIVEALEIAAKRYKADGLPIAFDLQMEAEVLGCDLAWARETPPSVASHPLSDAVGKKREDLPEFSLENGRFPVALEATRRAKEKIGQEVALYGLITGPLTLAMHLRGDDLFLDMFDDEDAIKELLDYCAEIGCQAAEGYLEAGADIIAVVDPMTSQIGDEHFTDLIAGPLNRIFDHVRAKGGLSSLFVCGNATRNLEAMAQTTCDNMSVDENVDLVKLREVAKAGGKSFGGNLKLTTVLLMGEPNDARRDTMRCLDVGGEQGFILAPGCDLPYSTKPENLEAVAELVHDPYQRDVARRLPALAADDDYSDVLVPDYPVEPNVIIDVVTLDSSSCAPCTYMLKSAQEAARSFGKPVEVREHKITGRDGLAYMKHLNVQAIPSICVDGEPRFASIIPKRAELVEVLESAAGKKKTASA